MRNTKPFWMGMKILGIVMVSGVGLAQADTYTYTTLVMYLIRAIPQPWA
jgi:hypothetical protein